MHVPHVTPCPADISPQARGNRRCPPWAWSTDSALLLTPLPPRRPVCVSPLYTAARGGSARTRVAFARGGGRASAGRTAAAHVGWVLTAASASARPVTVIAGHAPELRGAAAPQNPPCAAAHALLLSTQPTHVLVAARCRHCPLRSARERVQTRGARPSNAPCPTAQWSSAGDPTPPGRGRGGHQDPTHAGVFLSVPAAGRPPPPTSIYGAGSHKGHAHRGRRHVQMHACMHGPSTVETSPCYAREQCCIAREDTASSMHHQTSVAHVRAIPHDN